MKRERERERVLIFSTPKLTLTFRRPTKAKILVFLLYWKLPKLTIVCSSFYLSSAQSNRQHLGLIKFSLSSDFVDLRYKLVSAKLRVCLRVSQNAPRSLRLIASASLESQPILAQHFAINLTLPSSSRPLVNSHRKPGCSWVEMSVVASAAQAVDRLVAGQREQVVLTYKVQAMAADNTLEKVTLLKAGHHNQPILVLGRDSPIDVSINTLGNLPQPTPIAETTEASEDESVEGTFGRFARSADLPPTNCRVTKHGADGSLLVPRASVEFHVDTLVHKEGATLAQTDGGNNSTNSSALAFKKKTTIYVLPGILRYLVVHRCRGECTHLTPGQKVPLHYKALRYFARPSEESLGRLCCRAKTFSDSPGVTVQAKGNRWAYTRITLKQLHASSCQCTWL